MEVVSRSQVPALILDLASERIVAASPAARDLLSPGGEELVGRPASFSDDTPTGALDLLVAGRLRGYETVRPLRLSDGSTSRLPVWVRAIGEATPPRHALVVTMAHGRPAGTAACPLPEDFNAVAGTTDVYSVGSSRDFAGLTDAGLPGLSELSSRELEIVTMLLAGDRVPAIARKLFIAQSTVRNHLSSVFGKLNVGSQQELIDSLRATKDRTPLTPWPHE